jgi:peptidyl-dipeptidase Dcp
LERRTFLAASGALVSSAATAQSPSRNPLLEPWTTPYGLPPFDRIRPEHFLPAIQEAMKQELAEIDKIANQTSEPTFANTMEELERAGKLLTRIERALDSLTASNTNKELQAVERDVAPLRAKQRTTILMNPKLFARVDAIYKNREQLGLNPEQLRLVDVYHKRFVRAGAQLDPEKKKRLAEIEEKLASLGTKFSQNVLAEEASFELVLDGEKDLAGLPESFRAAAAEAARARGKEGKYVITLQRPSVQPFLELSPRRDLREKAFKAWAARGDNENQYDNKAVIREIVLLRIEKAKLLGYATFAHYKLEDTMAKTPDAVLGLLNEVWKPAVATAKLEAAELEKAMKADGVAGPLEPWDWRYYAEKVRLAKYDLNEEQVKPYFPLDRMVEASFWVANQLFGVSFTERKDLPAHHPDVRSWEVRNADGKVIGIFQADYYSRPSKRSGAWMSSYRSQQKLDGEVIPLILNNCNFNKPPAGEQTLLSYDDAETLFHEFGHALHGLLSNVTYPRLSGTSVARDFVELPSQIYEHWLAQKPVLTKFAKHYKTGEPIPAELLEKINKARNFNQGFLTVEYLASAFVDMDWHLLDKPQAIDVREMESAWLKKIGMPREIIMRHRSPHFQHVFSGDGYSAGYYSYMWSEVLDADGFEAFQEKSDPFDRELARKLYQYIYSAGNSADPMSLYESFRGRKPDTGALMRMRGFQ